MRARSVVLPELRRRSDRPTCLNTSTTYPGVAYGHMEMGCASAPGLVSTHSPSYGRFWLSVGSTRDTISHAPYGASR